MHQPVLLNKVLEYLDPKPNENFVDCTAGSGGHVFALAERIAPKGKVLALDWDTEAIAFLKQEARKKKLHNQVIFENENFANVTQVIEAQKFGPIAGILFDLGFSSDQLSRKKGLSFLKDEPLDMRYSDINPVTAEKIVNFSSKTELEKILKEYGEEQFAKQISAAIVEQRTIKPITKTGQLVHIIQEATPKAYQHKKIHPATKTFQALRIATNNELENIQQGLGAARDILPVKATLAVISFHSLEDRIAKNFLKTASFELRTKKPITASATEIKSNPRARSAKLRVATKL